MSQVCDIDSTEVKVSRVLKKQVPSIISRAYVRAGFRIWRVAGGGMQKDNINLFVSCGLYYLLLLVRSNFSILYKNNILMSLILILTKFIIVLFDTYY